MIDLKKKDYIAVVQCDIVQEVCSGYQCEQAFHARTGGFADYAKKTGKDAKWLQLIWDQGHEIIGIIPIKGMIRDAIMASLRARTVDSRHSGNRDRVGARCWRRPSWYGLARTGLQPFASCLRD